MTHKQHGREFVGTVALKRGPNLGHARECSALLSDRAKNFAYILAKLFAKRRTSHIASGGFDFYYQGAKQT